MLHIQLLMATFFSLIRTPIYRHAKKTLAFL